MSGKACRPAAVAPRLARLARVQHVAVAPEILIGGNDVDVVGLDRDLALHVRDRHLGVPAQQLAQVAFLRRVQMRNHDETEPAVRRHSAEQPLQRFQSAGGRTDADDGEISQPLASGGAGIPRLIAPTPQRAAALAQQANSVQLGCAAVERREPDFAVNVLAADTRRGSFLFWRRRVLLRAARDKGRLSRAET